MNRTLRSATSDPDKIMFSAQALQELVRSFEDDVDPSANPMLFEGQFIARPALLAFAMELALKAWLSRESENGEVPRTHDLLKLFNGLEQGTQTALENAYPEIPSALPYSLRPLRMGLRSLLETNSTAFVQWRYIHEHLSARFPTGEFSEALACVIEAFGKR